MKHPKILSAFDGDRFTFPTHINEFLVKREEALSTEAFLVKIPALGSSHVHHHGDMEQVFYIIAGSGVVYGEDGDYPPMPCNAGDIVYIPAGTKHAVRSNDAFDMSYLCVNAFLPEVATEATSLSHAEVVVDLSAKDTKAQELFVPAARALLDASEVIVRRSPENENIISSLSQNTLPRNAGASEVRVQRIGPFQFCVTTKCGEEFRIPLEKVVTFVKETPLPNGMEFYVSGSQSPISVKLPHQLSDVDLVAVVDPKQIDFACADEAYRRIEGQKRFLGLNEISFGMVMKDWLKLPYFYEAVRPIEDNHLWSLSGNDRQVIAAGRLADAVSFVTQANMKEMLAQDLKYMGLSHLNESIAEVSLTPRWISPDRSMLLRRIGRSEQVLELK